MTLIRTLIKKISKFNDITTNQDQTIVSESHNSTLSTMPTTISPTDLFDEVIEKVINPYHSVFWGDRLLSLDKSAGFMSDPIFRKSYEAIRGSHQYDQYKSPHTISWRLHTLVWAVKSCLMLDGDFIECGTFKGDMAWFITQLVDLETPNKKFYLYDTFDGFSEKYSSDDDYPDNPGFIAYANQFYTDPSLYTYVQNRFKDQKNVIITKGVVPDILIENAPQKIAFMHIDLNSPAAEVGALEFLFPRLVSGGMIVFDDYGWKIFHKQKDAEDAFMSKHNYSILELPTGQGLIIKR